MTTYNSELEDYSPSRFEEDNRICEGYLAELAKIQEEVGASLSETERLNLRLFKAELETFTSGYKFKG